MKVRIHRGAKQIGGTCVEIESEEDRIAIDFGLPLDGDANDMALVPDLALDSLRGIVISHPHIDHYGLLHYAPESVPVLMGAAGRRIIRAAAPFTGQILPTLDGYNLEHETPIRLGRFCITPYLVDHSAFDAYSLLIEADSKRLFYSGDFRGHGRKSKLFSHMVRNPPKGIDVLLMEGSSLSRLDDDAMFPTETEIENQLVEVFGSTQGLAMVHTSAQNIDRVVSLYCACKRANRIMVVDLYAAAVLEATGHGSIPQSSWQGVALYVPESQRRLIKRNSWFELLDRHQQYNRIFTEQLQQDPSKYVFMFRPLLMNDLDNANCLDGASFVYSQWDGYLERGSYSLMQTWLHEHEIPMTHIHTSGHASPVDLKRFANALAPKTLVPIHSFSPEKYETLFSNVVYRNDGEWWDA